MNVPFNNSGVQANQLDRLKEQLQHELASAKQQLQELGAAQDGLRAQVGPAPGIYPVHTQLLHLSP